MAANPVSGAGYLFAGIKLITRPGLRRFVLVPLLINILVFSAAIWYGISQFESFLFWMESNIPSWLHWLDWILWPLFVLVLVILVFYSFTLVANLLASPFNSLLAEKVELHLTGRPLDEGGGWKKALVELLPTLLDEVKKLLFAAVLAIPFLILFLIPGINLAAPLLWFLYTAWILTLEYSDFPMGNHGLKFAEMRARLRRKRLLGLSFGAATAGMTMVPVLNFIVMPSAVAGATAMWIAQLSKTEDS
ncbi:MAG: sulfate transporter CysZ [Chromatiaceae bacterium]|jgi:CysZ protein|nr:sulfate transporter CysZ [Chromatiaceae bacterium]